MGFTDKILFLVLHILALSLRVEFAQSGNLLFLHAPPVIEGKYLQHHTSKTSFFSRRSNLNWVCQLDIVSRVRLCVKILEELTSSQFTPLPLDLISTRDRNCLPRSVKLGSPSTNELSEEVFRCTSGFVLENLYESSTTGVESKPISFFITWGIDMHTVFVLQNEIDNSKDDAFILPADDGLINNQPVEHQNAIHMDMASHQNGEVIDNVPASEMDNKRTLTVDDDVNQKLYVSALFKRERILDYRMVQVNN